MQEYIELAREDTVVYDFKKEFKGLYVPNAEPGRVEAPAMIFAAVAGSRGPNEEGDACKQALELLYAFSYAVKASNGLE